jgi:hypothetical protein
MNGRNSEAYGQLLLNRFTAKYLETAKIKIGCTAGCTHFVEVRANSATIFLNNMRKHYICDECEYCESSMDEEPDSY